MGIGGSAGAMSTSAGTGGGAPVVPAFLSDPSGSSTTQLQLANGYLYWLSGTHRLARAAVDGSGAATIFTHDGTQAFITIGGVAVDAQNVYFTDTGADGTKGKSGVYKMPLDGSAAPTKIAEAAIPGRLSLDGDTLCFVDGSELHQVKTDGSNPLTLLHAAAASYRTRLLVSEGFLYFHSAIGSESEDVYRVPLNVADPSAATAAGDAGSGGPATVPQKISIVTGNYEVLLATTADSKYVYWATVDSVFRWKDGDAAPTVAGVVVDQLQVSNTSAPRSALLGLGNFIYWVGGDGLNKQQIPDGKRTNLSSKQPDYIVADASYIYGTLGKDIVRVAR
jgi:hypothetical protein